MRIALVGNCQVRTYELLLQRAVPGCEIAKIDFSEDYSRDPQQREAFLARVSHHDLVLVQHNGLSHTSPKEIRSAMGADRVRTICNFFFRGLFPDICYIGRISERVGFLHYNSILVFSAFLRGMSVEECLGLFTPETFAELGLFDAWADSLAELKARDAAVDYPGATLTEEACREYPAFRAFNHPTSGLLEQYLYSVLRDLGVPHQPVSLPLRQDPLYFLELPVYDLVAQHYRLPYRTTQFWRFATSHFLGQREYVERSYQAFAAADPDALVLNSPEDLLAKVRQRRPDWVQRRE